MIEGGGLGSFAPEQIGPSGVQSRNGVIDVLVTDEAAGGRRGEAIPRRIFQGRDERWQCADQRALRHALPENRLRVYDMRAAMRGVADTGSLLELRAGFGAGIVTALARIEGRPVGLLANNPHHLGGAIDAEAADKAARFMQLCDAHGLPLVSLCDTPGFMVGPEVEARGAGAPRVPHVRRRRAAARALLRGGAAQGLRPRRAGDDRRRLRCAAFTVAWPTGEFGAMGLEGAVGSASARSSRRRPRGRARRAVRGLVAPQYANGEAIHMARRWRSMP